MGQAVDPYVQWALASDFVDLRRPDVQAPWPVVVLELVSPGKQQAVAKQFVRSKFRFAQGSVYATATVHPDDLVPLQGSAQVRRLNLSMPLIPQRAQRPAAASGGQPSPRAPRKSRSRVLVGVIDNGCPFAHVNFRRVDGGTRLWSLWDMDGAVRTRQPTDARLPKPFCYGVEATRSALDDWITHATTSTGAVDEDHCYEAAGLVGLRRRAVHGAHVLDQFCGPKTQRQRVHARTIPPSAGAGTTGDGGVAAAASADIVFVQLPRDALQDSAALGLAAHVLDGVRYVLGCASRKTKRIVINVSYAAALGARDGSSLLSCALQELLRQHGDRLSLVFAAGNDYALRTSAFVDTSVRESCRIALHVPAGSETATVVECWLPSHLELSSLRLVDPAGRPVALADGVAQLPGVAGGTVATLVGPASGSRGARPLILVVIAPTTVQNAGRPAASPGTWWLEWAWARDDRGGELIEAYIARAQQELGGAPRARQAYWVDAALQRPPVAAPRVAHGPRAGLVQVRGTLSALAAGTTAVVVGGFRRSDRRPAVYSASGDERRSPDLARASEDAPSVPGIRGAGSRSGAVVRLSGTSFAAPQEARDQAQRFPTPSVPVGEHVPQRRPMATPSAEMRDRGVPTD